LFSQKTHCFTKKPIVFQHVHFFIPLFWNEKLSLLGVQFWVLVYIYITIYTCSSPHKLKPKEGTCAAHLKEAGSFPPDGLRPLHNDHVVPAVVFQDVQQEKRHVPVQRRRPRERRELLVVRQLADKVIMHLHVVGMLT